MKEDLLHYLWKYQLFDKSYLRTNQGENLEILNPGTLNPNAGPDFLDARIRIGKEYWAGNVEIHVTSSAWMQHKHQFDPAYNTVILHVVWNEDQQITLPDGNILPSLSLNKITNPNLIDSINNLTTNLSVIPCLSHWKEINPAIIINTLERALVERMKRKSEEIEQLLRMTKGDWEEAFYRIVCRAFGMKVNAEPFFSLSGTLPYNVLRRHRNKREELEAILFGTAGFLEDKAGDDYQKLLADKFTFFRKKYGLVPMNKEQWRFMRTRPENFPTIRIAQLASLIYHHERFFSTFNTITEPAKLTEMLTCEVSDYWKSHRHFGKKVLKGNSKPGESLARNIIVNAIVPALVAFADWTRQPEYRDHGFYLLEITSPEDNKITRIWKKEKFEPVSAFESQAKLELYSGYCVKRRCLDCMIGSTILR